MKGIYENSKNLQLYIKAIKDKLKTINNVSLYIDDLTLNDAFIIGIVYMVTDIKNNKIYIGSEQRANGYRQKQHIPTAIYKYNKRVKLNKFQFHILQHRNELNIFIDEIIEIVVYKDIEMLYEREQYYIDKYDTIKNGMNTMKAKVNNKITYNKQRQIIYNSMNSFFRRYGRQMMMFKDKMNDYYKTNKSYDYYKNIIESNTERIKDFIDIFVYDKEQQQEQYNILYNYILYEQRHNKFNYFYENDIVNKPVINNIVNNDNIDVIDFIDSNDIININVIDCEAVIIDVI